MVRLREIPRTATFAWSQGSARPLIATGTKAGAVDADFSIETQLEIWDLALDSPEQGLELQPSGRINVDSRFHDIAWSHPTDDNERGVIAGALESGSLDLWDAEELENSSEDSLISRTTKHSGPIKALQFNSFRHELLASAGAKGELFITDINNSSNPSRLGTSAARADDYDALDWNKKVPHILATGSNGGFVTVWDVKNKKESLQLNNLGRKAVSAIAWNPEEATKLATAVPNDQDPVILLWDLRNSNAPERTLKLHDLGVLSLDWCFQDSDLLLSCAKDNRTIVWNPHTGQAHGEFPVVTNWTFQTRWNPHNPSLIATAAFDGKITVQSIQSTKSEADQGVAAATQSLDAEDFFSRAPSQPQGASFSLAKAPKWLQRPAGVSFAFGGKLVRFSTASGSKQSKISISTFAVDSALGSASERFEEALQKGNLAEICESKIAKAKTEEEKADWTVIENLISGNPRKKLLEYLGLSAQDQDTEEVATTNGTAEAKDESSFFDGPGEGDTFLSNLAATKGAKTNNPFKMYTGTESDADKKITRALLLGSFDSALDVCLKENRLSDAFMIAICGGQKSIERAQAAYFKHNSDGPNYLRLLASIVGKNLWDVVYNADLENWKEVMATICTYADESEFSDLCEALGDRLEEWVEEGSDPSTVRKDASFCYLAGSKLQKVVVNWAQELQESETAGMEEDKNDTSFSVHARFLQNFIEKVTVFRQVTGFQDADLQKTSDWKLAPLYAKYTEYADVVAAHGHLKTAEKYLDLLPAQYPAAEVARNRVKQATRKVTPQATQRASATSTTHKPASQRGQRVVATYQPVQPPSAPTASPYTPAGPTIPQAQSFAQPPAPTRGYTPVNYQQPTQLSHRSSTSGIPQPPPFPGYQPSQPPVAVPPPPTSYASSSSVPPPPPPKGPMVNWNDPPDLGLKPASRRGTPGATVNPITSPFPNQQINPPPPPTGAPFSSTQRATPPLPPPPKGPPMTSPPTAGHPHHFQQERPPSAAANAYAPSQLSFPQAPSMIPRGASPYQPPPAAAPPSNRYAPAPSAQHAPSQVPPPRQTAPPSNPYAPQSYNQPPPAAHPPPPTARSPPQGPPLGFSRPGPPPGGPPQGPPRGPPQARASASPPMQRATPGSRPGTASSQRSQPTGQKHPRGDRSHIPDASRPIYEILSADMDRVKSRAPPAFKPQVLDTEKRLNILFDHLNNEDLLKPDTVAEMNELAAHLQARRYNEAHVLFTDLMTNKTEEGANWMVGVKRLIQMSRATPA